MSSPVGATSARVGTGWTEGATPPSAPGRDFVGAKTLVRITTHTMQAATTAMETTPNVIPRAIRRRSRRLIRSS
jgi:hypothetical protein